MEVELEITQYRGILVVLNTLVNALSRIEQKIDSLQSAAVESDFEPENFGDFGLAELYRMDDSDSDTPPSEPIVNDIPF